MRLDRLLTVEEVMRVAERRVPKMFITYEDIIVDVAPDISIGELQTGLSLRLPKGLPATMLNSLRYKDLIQDMVLLEREPAKLQAKYADQLTVRRFEELKQGLAAVRRNWWAVMPEAARLGRRGKVSIQFSIARNGSVPKLVIVTNSGTDALDRAAVAGISASNPFPPLPTEFKGDQIRLQFNFAYNMPR